MCALHLCGVKLECFIFTMLTPVTIWPNPFAVITIPHWDPSHMHIPKDIITSHIDQLLALWSQLFILHKDFVLLGSEGPDIVLLHQCLCTGGFDS